MQVAGHEYREVWVADFEFVAGAGERPRPVCLVARELGSGRDIRLWEHQLNAMSAPPYGIDGDCLLVAYFASAELGCHRALNWPPPANVLDLYAEFRVATNGRALANGRSLLGAMTHYGLDAIAAQDKEEMRELVMSGGPWSALQQHDILDYCATDVDATARLFTTMAPSLDLPRALLRGRYMKAVAAMEFNGIPMDVPILNVLRDTWEPIQDCLIAEVDASYGVYDGRSFSAARFGAYLAREGIAWPRLETGRLALDDDTFRDMARAH